MGAGGGCCSGETDPASLTPFVRAYLGWERVGERHERNGLPDLVIPEPELAP